MQSLLFGEGSPIKENDRTFKEELVELSNNYKSSKLEEVKGLLKVAAENGKFHLNLQRKQLDDYSITWLTKQGLKVIRLPDSYDDFTYQVSWK